MVGHFSQAPRICRGEEWLPIPFGFAGVRQLGCCPHNHDELDPSNHIASLSPLACIQGGSPVSRQPHRAIRGLHEIVGPGVRPHYVHGETPQVPTHRVPPSLCYLLASSLPITIAGPSLRGNRDAHVNCPHWTILHDLAKGCSVGTASFYIR